MKSADFARKSLLLVVALLHPRHSTPNSPSRSICYRHEIYILIRYIHAQSPPLHALHHIIARFDYHALLPPTISLPHSRAPTLPLSAHATQYSRILPA
jgi:hypothetical protein